MGKQAKRIIALILSGILSISSLAQQPGVSVTQDSAAKENLGRVIQSPEARSANLPSRNTLQSQPTLVLPDMGDPGGDALSPLDERKIGEQIMREIRRDRDFSNDWPIYDYLNSMERRLMQAAKRLQLGGANAQGSAAYDYEVFAVKDPSINAFALPGGFIGFHTGLLITAETDSEVASVMGHEIGHVLQRHLARSLERQGTNSIIALAGIVLGALAAASNPGAAAGLITGGQALAIQNQLSYSRDAEREADRIGFQILQASGYDVNGAPAFFQRLQKAYGIMDSGVPGYLRTHPLTTDRIADMQDRARTVSQNRVPSALEFYLVKARARIEQSGSTSGLFDLRNLFESLSKQASPEKQMEGFYGLALVAQKQGRFDQAEGFLQKARAIAQNVLAPGSPVQRQSLSFDYTASELALARGKPEEALQYAQNAAKADSFSFSAVVATVNAELRLGRTNDAINLLRAKTKAQPNETIWWDLLARAYDQDKKIGLRHYALAEKFATEGAWPSAIEQLKIARSVAGNDFYLGSVIDARLRVFQNQYREEQKEQKKS
ncbi:M48 family metallopeptidase [Polynucleobacter sp. MWH-UH24A]|uniref:M48 family metalloprotease n=1 Tax=Polynucleobacter sp. MWH-UH24A TaxID=2689110 RepID=UPI001BFD6BE3|nr:M48 family metalloprotease [Polynucleobacter sp. MWH-UH24A]QWD75863.1 M48 family metallopeptidase [Polynucleobacter sp. MWH-UH24A]